MKTILTAIILLTSVYAFAEEAAQPVNTATNSITNTNEPSGYKPRKATSKADAYTGATRAKKQKQRAQ